MRAEYTYNGETLIVESSNVDPWGTIERVLKAREKDPENVRVFYVADDFHFSGTAKRLNDIVEQAIIRSN